MTLVSTKKMLRHARNNQYAVGHFNTFNLEQSQAIIRAAEEMNSPVIVATSKSTLGYAGYDGISSIVKILAKKARVPVALHLDHGPDFDTVKNCVKHGWTSVMRDSSHMPYKENVRETKRAVKFCHPRKVAVEAELGRLSGEEGWVKSDKHVFTDPDEAAEFVSKTGCDSLAVSVGISHGAYKFQGRPKLDLKRLDQIASVVNIPLVLHGASSVPRNLIDRANKHGAKIKGSHGVPPKQIQSAIGKGIAKVNTDTDLRIAFIAGLRRYLKDSPTTFDMRKVVRGAMDDVQEYVEKRIDQFGSCGQA